MSTTTSVSPTYRAYNLRTFRSLSQIQALTAEEQFAIEVVGHVLPFKANSYVVDELIDWSRVPDDPIFRLTFPHRDMLSPEDFGRMARALRMGRCQQEIACLASSIRCRLNPHPAGQIEHNVPTHNGGKLMGIQHKYRETVLFFPSHGQTCHAYCSFCFRWPQFTGMGDLKFAARESDDLISYLSVHPEVTDVLFTGGDPMVMKTRIIAKYVRTLLKADLPHIQTIRFGTKSLAFWPYRFLQEPDASEILQLFRDIVSSGRHLSIMAHFSHPRELETSAVRQAIARIRETGAQIRTQSPILRHINDSPHLWSKMWREQVNLGCVPYYMFVVRDTGAQHYFGVPLVEAWRTFAAAYKKVSGVARTVRGPSMSADEGKIQVLGVTELFGEKLIALTMLQSRDANSVMQPFFTRYNPEALWIDDLERVSRESRWLSEKFAATLAA